MVDTLKQYSTEYLSTLPMRELVVMRESLESEKQALLVNSADDSNCSMPDAIRALSDKLEPIAGVTLADIPSTVDVQAMIDVLEEAIVITDLASRMADVEIAIDIVQDVQ